MTLRDDLLSRFELIRVLGRGLMGKVQLARDRQDGHLVALKSIAKASIHSSKEVAQLWEERNILARNSHSPFLVHMEAAFQTPTHLVFVLEYHAGGDLAGILGRQGRLSEADTVFYAAELVLALAELRRLGVVYRDLKPENVLIDAGGHLVLTDFGLSRQGAFAAAVNPLRTFCGTADYLAPEVLTASGADGYDHGVDLWSLGVMLYEMVVGVPPYWDEVPVEMYRKIRAAECVRFPLGVVGEGLGALIAGLLRRDPRDRIGYRDMNELFAHPAFGAVDWQRAAAKQLAHVPYVPVLQEAADVAHFERQFTDLLPMFTPNGTSPGLSGPFSSSCSFSGFTYR